MADPIHPAIRIAYQEAANRAGGAHAFELCVEVLRRHHPEMADPELRKAVARMIAEEPSNRSPRL